MIFNFALGFANTIPLVVFCRGGTGFFASISSVCLAVTTDTVHDDSERATWFGWFGSSLGIGTVVGPIFGGLLADYPLYVMCSVAGGLMLVGVILCILFVKESLPPEKRRPLIRCGKRNKKMKKKKKQEEEEDGEEEKKRNYELSTTAQTERGEEGEKERERDTGGERDGERDREGRRDRSTQRKRHIRTESDDETQMNTNEEKERVSGGEREEERDIHMNGTGMSSPTYSPLPPASSTSPLLTHSNTPSITPSPSISETPTMIEMQQQNAGMTMGETQETETMMMVFTQHTPDTPPSDEKNEIREVKREENENEEKEEEEDDDNDMEDEEEQNRIRNAMLKETLTTPGFLMAVLNYFTSTTQLSAIQAILPQICIDRYDYSAKTIGFVTMMYGIGMMIVQIIVIPLLVPRTGEKIPLICGVFTASLSLLLQGFIDSSAALWPIAFVFGLGQAFVVPTSTSIFSYFGDASIRGTILGIGQSMQALSRSVTPIACSALYDIRDWMPYLVVAIVATMGVLTLVPVRLKKKKKEEEEEKKKKETENSVNQEDMETMEEGREEEEKNEEINSEEEKKEGNERIEMEHEDKENNSSQSTLPQSESNSNKEENINNQSEKN